jgi:hypothetical protein
MNPLTDINLMKATLMSVRRNCNESLTKAHRDISVHGLTRETSERMSMTRLLIDRMQERSLQMIIASRYDNAVKKELVAIISCEIRYNKLTAIKN